MRSLFTLFLLPLAITQPQSAEPLELACEGVFAADSSQARLAERFGAENVIFARIWDMEASSPEVGVLFPLDPKRRLSIFWRDVEDRRNPGFIALSEGSTWTVQGLRVGMPLDEVEALNGRPFVLGGFDDVDRGGVNNWAGGALKEVFGPCQVLVQFSYPQIGMPQSLDDPVESQAHIHPMTRFLTLWARRSATLRSTFLNSRRSGFWISRA